MLVVGGDVADRGVQQDGVVGDPDALELAVELGVNRALERAGAKQGDTVVIGDHAFEYEDD